MSAGLLVAASGGLEQGLLIRVGGAAGAVALIALALVVPLYVTQRREVKRLLRWRELEPERGDEGAPQSYPAVAATAATAVARPQTGSYTTGSRMTPAERVTADRPALSRITAERAAIQSPSFWKRLIARGPRHPLVLAVIGILIAGAAVVVVGLSTNALDEQEPSESKGGGTGLDRAAVAVIVLNASSTTGLADKVADDVSDDGFTNVRTGVTGESNQTVVLYDDGFKHAASTLGKKLDVEVLQPLDRETQAIAPDADVVVIAGEDRAKA